MGGCRRRFRHLAAAEIAAPRGPCGRFKPGRGRIGGAWRLSREMDGKSAKADRAVAQIAERQHGVISICQLRAAGVSEDAARARVQAGRLHRLHRGIYAVGHSGISAHGRYMAAVLACGATRARAGRLETSPSSSGRTVAPADREGDRSVLDYWGAAVSHRSTANLWGLLSDSEGAIDVSIPRNSGRKKRRGIRVHRCLALLPAAVTLRSGIPVTTPARTISDLRQAASMRAGQGFVSARELRRAIRQADVLGLPIGDDVGRDRSRSDLERDFLRLCRRRRLPLPEVNVTVGRDLVDFLWRDRSLVVETDGYRYHRGRLAFEDDRERDLRLRALGFDVVRVSEKQVDEEPQRVAEVLVAALRVGADARQ